MAAKRLLVLALLVELALGVYVGLRMREADEARGAASLRQAWRHEEAITLLTDGPLAAEESRDNLREAIAWDYFLIPLYVMVLWLSLQLVHGLPERDPVRIHPMVLLLPAAAGLLDLIENRGILAMLDFAGPDLPNPYTACGSPQVRNRIQRHGEFHN